MCHYVGILGNGDLLSAQLLTILVIELSMAFWIWFYQHHDVELKRYALPIALWFIFLTLDVVLTAKGTYGNPDNEANALSRFIFEIAGFYGPALASVIWIALWALIIFAINKKINQPLAGFLSLAIFYSLAIGHSFGFASWYAPLCAWHSVGLFDWPFSLVPTVVFGCLAAFAHIQVEAIAKRFNVKT